MISALYWRVVSQTYLDVIAGERGKGLGQLFIRGGYGVGRDGHLFAHSPGCRAFQLVVHDAGQAVLVVQRRHLAREGIPHIRAVHLGRAAIRVAPFSFEQRDGRIGVSW